MTAPQEQAMTAEQAGTGTDLCYMGAVELAAAIRTKQLSPVEIVDEIGRAHV